MFVAIRPRGRPEGLWALPKGNIDPGERPEETAVREVEEETGARGRAVEKLGDVRYVYTQSWGEARGERVFKIVSFYLVRYAGGRVGEISETMRREVDEARWFPLAEASDVLAYGGEREMAEKARAVLADEAL